MPVKPLMPCQRPQFAAAIRKRSTFCPKKKNAPNCEFEAYPARVGAWLAIDIATVILLMLAFERGKAPSTRPRLSGLALIAITSVLAYWLEHDMYFPRT